MFPIRLESVTLQRIGQFSIDQRQLTKHVAASCYKATAATSNGTEQNGPRFFSAVSPAFSLFWWKRVTAEPQSRRSASDPLTRLHPQLAATKLALTILARIAGCCCSCSIEPSRHDTPAEMPASGLMAIQEKIPLFDRIVVLRTTGRTRQPQTQRRAGGQLVASCMFVCLPLTLTHSETSTVCLQSSTSSTVRVL